MAYKFSNETVSVIHKNNLKIAIGLAPLNNKSIVYNPINGTLNLNYIMATKEGGDKSKVNRNI